MLKINLTISTEKDAGQAKAHLSDNGISCEITIEENIVYVENYTDNDRNRIIELLKEYL